MVDASWECRNEAHVVFFSKTLNVIMHIKTQYPYKQFKDKMIAQPVRLWLSIDL